MGTVRIDDGTREFKIENNYGKEICRIHFRPADLSLLDRFEKISGSLSTAIEPLREIGVQTDGAPEDESERGWAAMKQAEAEVIRLYNELLDADDLGEVFKTRSAFSVIGGKFFCEILLEAIGGVIAEAFEEEAKLTRDRIAKYLPEDAQDAGATTANA